jgi:hypothetical protein
MNDEKKYQGLRRFNLGMGFLHLMQGILMIVLSNDTAYPIYTNFLKFDTTLMALVPDPKLAAELRFGPAVAVFLLISAFAHFFLATVGYKLYVSNLKKGMNQVRFYEYALYHDGATQSEYTEDQLDCIYLWIYRRDHPLDRNCALFCRLTVW